MMRSRGLSLLIAAGGLLLWAGGPAAAGNPYGVHTFLQDHMTDTAVQSHLAWSRRLTRPGGHVKQLIYPILNNTPGPQASWVNFVSACYQRQLVPVLRIATMMQNGAWVKPTPDAPGDYTSFANAVKRVIQGLPLDPVLPLYVEVLNETNNNGEWSWQANPTEYAHVLEDVAVALHAIGPRVKVLNGALSPGGDYDNLLYIRAMFAAVPTLGNHLDGWASHTYSGDPPERNNHNGNAVNPRSAIDAYTTELAVLADYMPVANLKVIITEMDFVGVDEVERAARMMRAFRDFWSQWPEIMAVCPWYFCNPLSNGQGPDWVYPMSGTLPDGYPTMPKPIYDAVAALAKPGDVLLALGDILPSGRFAEAGTGISTGRFEAAGSGLGGGTRVLRGGVAAGETALWALFSTQGGQATQGLLGRSGAVQAAEVRFFQATGGQMRLGLLSEGGFLTAAGANAGLLSGPARQEAIILVFEQGLESGITPYGLAPAVAAWPGAAEPFLSGAGTQPTRLAANIAAGQSQEVAARAWAVARGETLLRTQFQQGAVMRGIDFASFLRTPEGGVTLFLNEVKGTAGLVSPGRFTSLGMGRGGQRVFHENLGEVRKAILTQVPPGPLQDALLLQPGTVRLLGPSGFGVTSQGLTRIQAATNRPVVVVIVPSGAP